MFFPADVSVHPSVYLAAEFSYYRAHQIIREHVTGVGAGHGPYIAIHDGFIGMSKWAGFLTGSDRMVLDTHPYFAFSGAASTPPMITDDGSGEPGGIWPKQACDAWGPGVSARCGHPSAVH